MDAIAVALPFDRGHIGAHAEIDAAIAHGLGQTVAEVHIEIAQDLLAAIEHGHVEAVAYMHPLANGDRVIVLKRGKRVGMRYTRETTHNEVLRLIVQGLSNREIAQHLYLSEKTVKAHLAAIFRKLGVTNRTQAAMVAVQMGVGPIPGALVNE